MKPLFPDIVKTRGTDSNLLFLSVSTAVKARLKTLPEKIPNDPPLLDRTSPSELVLIPPTTVEPSFLPAPNEKSN
ncbi:TPA: hypothetical protein ACXIBI_000203 [Proteus mirabilis]